MNSRKNPGATFYRLMAHAERGFIELALAAAKWNRTVAALELGISYRGLLYKIEKHGLQPPSRDSETLKLLQP
jgi:DNA-binding NtrC family response regulator